MGHIQYRSSTRAENTPAEWLAVGANIGQLVNQFASRSDLVAYVGPGAGGPAPACYTPATAEVEVNVDVAFGKNISPSDIGDLLDREVQFQWPKATGAIFHEALHARYSNWDFEAAAKELSEEEFRALILLEEGRIEAAGVQTTPGNAGFLRTCALEIVLADIEAGELAAMSDTNSAASLAALALARVDAGVLESEDVETLESTIAEKLSEEALEELRELWLTAQGYSNHFDISGLYSVARRWVEIVKERSRENGEPEDGAGEPGGMSTASDSGSGEASEFMKKVMKALKESSETATVGAFEQLADQEQSEEWDDIVKSRTNDAKTQREAEQVATDVFGKGTGPMPDSPTFSRLAEERAPTGAERSAAVKVASLLDKAKYRERDEVEIHSILPPGRLRTRAAVQGAALKSKGVMTQAEPWRRTVRKHVDDPTLSIGVMVDISGSMAEAMQPMATTAWVMSEAVRRIQGKSAMVYFGTDVFPTLKPGQRLDNVQVYTAPDGTEKFDKAFKSLNGVLSLLHGSGARLLVIVSDGCYTGAEIEATRKWLRACDQSGVGVLWLTFDNGVYVRSLARGTSAVLMQVTADPAAVATEIGTAAAKALSSASA